MFPFSRISRDEEMFSASRNSVSNSKVVGNTLKSTGLAGCTPRPSCTITDNMMSSTIRKSSSIAGMGMISAITIATTAIGTAISPSPIGDHRAAPEAWARACCRCC